MSAQNILKRSVGHRLQNRTKVSRIARRLRRTVRQRLRQKKQKLTQAGSNHTRHLRLQHQKQILRIARIMQMRACPSQHWTWLPALCIPQHAADHQLHHQTQALEVPAGGQEVGLQPLHQTKVTAPARKVDHLFRHPQRFPQMIRSKLKVGHQHQHQK